MGKEDIHISSLSGDTVNPPQLIKVARVSNEVFCGPPWYEGDFCDQCGGRKIPDSSVEDSTECISCQSRVVSVEMNGHDISEELRREHSRIATASVNGEIVGYGYGFMYMSPEEFVYEKYSTAVCRQSVRAAIEGYGITGTFYYFSGMGIVHRYRGLGISHLLAKEVDDYAQELNVPGVTRTLATSPIVTIRKKLGFEVIVASTLLHKDTENTNRVPMARKGT